MTVLADAMNRNLEASRMRLVEIDGIFFNPDLVVFVTDCTPSRGGPTQTTIRSVDGKDSQVTVKLSVGEVVQLLMHG